MPKKHSEHGSIVQIFIFSLLNSKSLLSFNDWTHEDKITMGLIKVSLRELWE
jgi:hypothetical protein